MEINDIFDAIERKDADDVIHWIHMQGFIQHRIDTLKNKDIYNSARNEELKQKLELEERFLITLMSFILLLGICLSMYFIFYYQVN